MRKCLILLPLLFVMILVISSCTTPPTPTPTVAPATPTPSAPPSGTTAPQINVVRVSPNSRLLSSGDSVAFSRTVHFEGSAPSSSLIKIYRGTTVIQTVSAAPSGEFQWNWGDTGTTEGPVTFSFTATQGSLAESTKTNYDIVVDGQGPYLHSLSAKSAPIASAAPTIQVNFNEAINVGNLTLFTTPGFWAVSFLPAANGSFIVTNVALSADGESVTLTGRPLFDYMLQGTQVTVLFGWVALMQVEDDAENLFNATLNFTTGIVIP